MVKVFVSVGMRGREYYEICNDIKRAREKIKEMFIDDVDVIDNLFCSIDEDESSRLYCLGEAIKKLGSCEACYFCKGWQNYKGCVVEYKVCELYGIKIIEE